MAEDQDHKKTTPKEPDKDESGGHDEVQSALDAPCGKPFPGRLRAVRELRKLSQSELAERAGFQPSAVSHFETGRRPSFDNLKRLADALDVTTDYLLGRVDHPKGTPHRAAGPVVDKLFCNAEKMSQDDLETLANFADMLAKKNRGKP